MAQWLVSHWVSGGMMVSGPREKTAKNRSHGLGRSWPGQPIDLHGSTEPLIMRNETSRPSATGSFADLPPILAYLAPRLSVDATPFAGMERFL